MNFDVFDGVMPGKGDLGVLEGDIVGLELFVDHGKKFPPSGAQELLLCELVVLRLDGIRFAAITTYELHYFALK